MTPSKVIKLKSLYAKVHSLTSIELLPLINIPKPWHVILCLIWGKYLVLYMNSEDDEQCKTIKILSHAWCCSFSNVHLYCTHITSVYLQTNTYWQKLLRPQQLNSISYRMKSSWLSLIFFFCSTIIVLQTCRTDRGFMIKAQWYGPCIF